MRIQISKILLGLALSFYLSVPFIQQAQADDTEVYFVDGGVIEPGKSQIMLLFEYSSAMEGGDRLLKVKEALETLAGNGVDPLTDDQQAIVESVDFGLAVFQKGNGNSGPEGIIRYPIGDSVAYTPDFKTVLADLLSEPTQKGNTPTIEGMSEVYRYFQSMKLNYAVTNKTHGGSHNGTNYTFASSDSDCASKALIVLAHGQINGSEWPNATAGVTPANKCSGKNCLGTDMVKYMREEGDVSTYTISPGSNGNNINNLNSWAKAGGTDAAIEWDSTVDCFDEGGLCTILLEIFEEVSSQGTSFVQAGVTVSQQNRLNHDNFLYFSQFQAEGIARWPGNLKKYQLVDGVLVDSDGKNAVGTDGLFLETRDENNIVTGGTSFWTDPNFPDGNQVESGGAVSKLSSFLSVTTDVNGLPIFDSFNRNIYTNKGNSEILLSDASIDKAAFGMAASTDDEFNDVKRQTLGYRLETRTLQDENGNDFDVKNVATSMNLMGDPLHSVPHVLRYANGKTLAFIGTNMGYLHAIDIDDGSESWSFIPSDLLPEMQNFLKDVDIDGNPEAHNYGLDGEITIVHSDTDLDFKVDSGELAYMFIGMRRGGNNYYVFDISSSSKPKYLYKISGLSHQAQSWSRMVIGNIEYGDTFKTVAIFGGGYDDLLDGLDTDSDGRSDSYNITYGKETTGNNVIIFDVVDKKVLWDLQGSSLPAKLQIGSVPGTIRAISLGNSPFANHMYVSDTKGQVFRFDISPTDSAFTVTGQRIANLGGTGTLLNNSDNRRFFYAPSVAKIRDEIFGQYIAIAIGSGYRAHPLDEEIEDQFYMIRDKAVYDSTPGFDAEANVNNLTDVTLEIDEDNVSATASADLLTSRGWKIDLSGDFGGSANPGEKVLSEARILNNKILFSTYIPSVSLPSAGSCSPVVGNGKLYGVNVQDGTSFFSDITRAIELNSPGIPPEPQVLIVDGQGIVCVGNECGDDNDDNYDTGDGNDKPIVEGEDFQQLVSAIIEKFSTIQRVKWKKKVDG